MYTQPHSAATTGKHRTVDAGVDATAGAGSCFTGVDTGAGTGPGETGSLPVDGPQADNTTHTSPARMTDGTPMRAARPSDAARMAPAMDSAASPVR